MTTTAESLGDLIVTLLKAANVAGGNVYGVRAWPTQEDQLPQVQLALPEEDKVSLGPNGGPQFTVTATLPLLITVEAPGSEDEEGAASARGQLGDIARLIERTIIGNPALMPLLQQVPFVKAHGRMDGRGEEVAGQRVMMIGLEFYQGPEDFYVQAFDDLDGLSVTLDAIDPADRTGTYASAFPAAVNPAPRTSGPDGRAEGGLSFDLTP